MSKGKAMTTTIKQNNNNDQRRHIYMTFSLFYFLCLYNLANSPLKFKEETMCRPSIKFCLFQ